MDDIYRCSLHIELTTSPPDDNVDAVTVDAFGDEWETFSQQALTADERERIYTDYFSIFPWECLPPDGGVGADVGCGSGRWAVLTAGRAAHLHLVDASDRALSVARSQMSSISNASFHRASVGALPFADASLDFAYSLGVLHHVPDTRAAVVEIARCLKPGAPLLLYLYYRFDGRPLWFRLLWKASDVLRRVLSRAPWPVKYTTSQLIAAAVYWPLARAARVLDGLGRLPSAWPLAYYRYKSFYVMRTDALDRLGTPLEQRFTRVEIADLLRSAGFDHVRFSPNPPYWCAIGIRRP